MTPVDPRPAGWCYRCGDPDAHTLYQTWARVCPDQQHPQSARRVAQTVWALGSHHAGVPDSSEARAAVQAALIEYLT